MKCFLLANQRMSKLPTKIKKLQTLRNKFLRIALKATRFIWNKQLCNDMGLPYLSTWITNQFKNFQDIRSEDEFSSLKFGETQIKATPTSRYLPGRPRRLIHDEDISLCIFCDLFVLTMRKHWVGMLKQLSIKL